MDRREFLKKSSGVVAGDLLADLGILAPQEEQPSTVGLYRNIQPRPGRREPAERLAADRPQRGRGKGLS